MSSTEGSANESKDNGTGARRGRPPNQAHRQTIDVNMTDDSTNSEDSYHGMRVGTDYQAVVPQLVSSSPAPDDEPERAVLVWYPSDDIPDSELNEFLSLAKHKYNYNWEQTLGLLCWHKFSFEKTMADLPNFTPFPDEWTVEDRVMFEEALHFHDKEFHKIREMLPHKSIASLVKYYYSWKKTRTQTSLMDRHTKKLTAHKEEGSDASDNESNSGNEQKEWSLQYLRDGQHMCCSNCFTTSNGRFHNTNKGILCRMCYSYWRRTGAMKRTSAQKRPESVSTRNLLLKPRKPPRGLYLNIEDLMAIARGPPEREEDILKSLDSEVFTLKQIIQNNKQIISQFKHKLTDGLQVVPSIQLQ